MTTLRNGSLGSLVDLLRSENVRRHDLVVPASQLAMTMVGNVGYNLTTETIDENGVTPAGWYTAAPTTVAHEQIGQAFDIPRPYYKRMLDGSADLLSDNVNHWLRRDERSFFVRTLSASADEPAVMRALLSDRFRPMDDLDTLLAALEGVRAAGINPSDLHIEADRSDRRMYVRIDAPGVTIAAPDLTERYVDPRSGRSGTNFPLVSAGVVIRNSDVGQGAWSIAPRVTFLVCKNGMTRTTEAQRKIHVGGRHDEGVVDWSDETLRRELAVITSKTTDAVSTFLTPEYLNGVANELRGFRSIELPNPLAAVAEVTKGLNYSKDDAESILQAFVKGGDLSPFGVAQAITNIAQDLDADKAADMENDSWAAMEHAARIGARG